MFVRNKLIYCENTWSILAARFNAFKDRIKHLCFSCVSKRKSHFSMSILTLHNSWVIVLFGLVTDLRVFPLSGCITRADCIASRSSHNRCDVWDPEFNRVLNEQSWLMWHVSQGSPGSSYNTVVLYVQRLQQKGRFSQWNILHYIVHVHVNHNVFASRSPC